MGIGGDRSRWVPRGGWFRRPIPRLLIVKRDVADAPEGAVSVEVIDSSGMVIRSVQTPWLNVVGELEGGVLVCLQGLLGADGGLRPAPWEGESLAVLDG